MLFTLSSTALDNTRLVSTLLCQINSTRVSPVADYNCYLRVRDCSGSDSITQRQHV